MLTARKTSKTFYALNSGADDYMLKPFHPQEVLVGFNALLTGYSYE
jgi:DNA-binding response OmpR family regulator